MSFEFKTLDDSDESTEEDKKDSTRSKKWVNPPLVPPRIPGQRPPMFESIAAKISKKTGESDDDDEEEDDKEEQATASKQAGKESNQEENAAEPDQPGSEQKPVIRDVTDESRPESSQPERQAGDSAAGDPEQVATAESEKPSQAPYEGVLHIRRQPESNKPESEPTEPAAQKAEETEPEPPAAAAGGGSPPLPPVGPPTSEAGQSGRPETPEPQPIFDRFRAAESWNDSPPERREPAVPPGISAEQHAKEVRGVEENAEKRGLRRGLVAGFLTGYVLKAYLANRKAEHYKNVTRRQFDKRDEQISSLQREKQQLAERMAARAEEHRRRQQELLAGHNPGGFEQRPASKPAADESMPPIREVEPEQEQIFDSEGNEIVLKPGWHVERSAGGYSVVLDKHNRVVHDAIRYGEAFKRDKKREQLSEDVFASVGAAGAPAVDDSDTAAPGTLPRPVASSRTQQPQTSAARQPDQVDLNHRLPGPRSNLASAASSPWLWTAVALLIIVYFLAALV